MIFLLFLKLNARIRRPLWNGFFQIFVDTMKLKIYLKLTEPSDTMDRMWLENKR